MIIHVILPLTQIVYIFSIKMTSRVKNEIITMLFTKSSGKLSNGKYSSAIFDSGFTPL